MRGKTSVAAHATGDRTNSRAVVDEVHPSMACSMKRSGRKRTDAYHVIAHVLYILIERIGTYYTWHTSLRVHDRALVTRGIQVYVHTYSMYQSSEAKYCASQ